jgi:hypothetical protein
MTPQPPIRVGIAECPGVLHAGEPAALTLLVTRPPEHPTPVILRNVSSPDKNVSLDIDLFERDLVLNPGEAYRLRLGLVAATRGVLNLGTIAVEAQEETKSELYNLPQQAIQICPSPARELGLSVEPICSYEEGTKVLVRLEHRGASTIDNLALRFDPPDRVRAGKAILRNGTLSPGRSETLEVVLAPGPISVHVSGSIDGHALQLSRSEEIPAALPRDGGRKFRFLEPRGLSVDQIEIRPVEPENAPPVERTRGTYAVQGKKHYRVVIRPSGAQSVKLRELPEQVHVLPNVRELKDRWEFEIFLPSNEAWSKPARLFYDVVTAGGTRTGEIHLAIQPPAAKRWIVAATLGAAITAQSLTLFVGGLFGSSPEWDQVWPQFNPFNGLEGRHFFQATSIPLIWIGLRCADWIQYRWRA